MTPVVNSTIRTTVENDEVPKPPATDADVIQLTDEFTWMGGNPAGIASLLREKQFTKEHIQSAISSVMSRHSCTTTYRSALDCSSVLEEALREFD